MERLNRQIAEALGWSEIYDDVLTSASGMEGTTPAGRVFQRIPDWEHSLDAVLAELPRQERCDFLIFRGERSDRFTVAITRGAVHLPNTSWVGKGETEQQAAAHALLKYAEWKRGGQGR